MVQLALVDDHSLIRNALVELINRFENFQVQADFSGGQAFLNYLSETDIYPEIALIDINMPILNGFEVTALIRKQYPAIKIIALTVEDDEESVLKMLRAGAVGYLLKDTETSEFEFALNEVNLRGFYHSELVTNSLLQTKEIARKSKSNNQYHFHGREKEFIILSATELTYKEIAVRMNVSPRTIDGYRESLFDNLNLRSRVGLVLFGIKNGIIDI